MGESSSVEKLSFREKLMILKRIKDEEDAQERAKAAAKAAQERAKLEKELRNMRRRVNNQVREIQQMAQDIYPDANDAATLGGWEIKGDNYTFILTEPTYKTSQGNTPGFVSVSLRNARKCRGNGLKMSDSHFDIHTSGAAIAVDNNGNFAINLGRGYHGLNFYIQDPKLSIAGKEGVLEQLDDATKGAIKELEACKTQLKNIDKEISNNIEEILNEEIEIRSADAEAYDERFRARLKERSDEQFRSQFQRSI